MDLVMEQRTFSVLVNNEPGVLAKVVGLFTGRGYNISSLTVSEIDAANAVSRITICTKGTPQVLEQIKAQLDRVVPVHRVSDLTVSGPSVERELALVKVAGQGEKRVEALRSAEIFGAKVVDSGLDHFTFELTGKPSKVGAFVAIMQPLGLTELSRTGVAALARGAHAL
ncbi:MAG: acetolactate synthase small subunit [Alphaproteobacteria bacterium]